MTNMDVDTVAACDDGAEIELLHPVTNQPTGMFVGLVGKDGKIWQGIADRVNDAERRRQYQAQKRGKVAEPRSSAELKAEQIAMLAEASTSFRTVTRNAKGEIENEVPTITLDGVALNFSVENAAKLYAARPSFKTQADEGIAELGNFIKS
jgi:hypothetical protein